MLEEEEEEEFQFQKEKIGTDAPAAIFGTGRKLERRGNGEKSTTASIGTQQTHTQWIGGGGGGEGEI